MRQAHWLGAMAALVIVGLAAGTVGVRGEGDLQDQATFVDFFKKYDQAFMAKDLEKLATFYHPDVTVYEGGGINPGWADYRDRHLGPELNAFGNLKFEHINITARAIGPDAAYVTGEYLLDATTEAREVRSGGLATYIMVREAGVWKIRHSHTSSKRRPAAGF